MSEYRYILEKGSKKHICPNCGKRRFVRYIDTHTGEYLPEQYGRCDREINCPQQDFNNPYKDGYSKMICEQEQGNKTDWKPQGYKPIQKPKIKPVFFPFEKLKSTLKDYDKNVFIQNLLTNIEYPFNKTDIEKVVSLYRLGTIENKICFPFIDIKGNIRTVQVKQFDNKNHTTGTTFLHSIIEKHYTRNNEPLPEWLEAYNKNELKVSCLFGEHLLSKYPHNTIALVEAPKTAIYGTLYFGFPEHPTNLLWLAVYNVSSLNFDKVKELKGRNVLLFPDLKAFDKWSNKINEIKRQLPNTYFKVSNLLETKATEQDKQKGNDLADYLIKQDWRLFRIREVPQQKPETVTKVTKVIPKQNNLFSHSEPKQKLEVFNTEKFEPLFNVQPQNWSKDITELETYFNTIQLPKNPINFKQGSKIIDCTVFIDSHFATVKRNNGNSTFLPYLNRLKEIKQILTSNSLT